MRRALLLIALLTLMAPALPASADAPPPVACPSDDGRERLTPDGRTYTFEAPVAPANAALPRQANFYLKLDLAPAAMAAIDFRLSWPDDGASDFDLYVLDAAGATLGSSIDITALDGPGELVSLELAHCDDIQVAVRNFTGDPRTSLTLSMTVTGTMGALACAEGDPAPGCAGKAAGEAPIAVPDTRTRLWLGGDRPGQLAMLHGFDATSGVPYRSALKTARPTSGTPNQYTRAVLGNYTLERNLLMAFYTIDMPQPRDITGDVPAAIWVSSPTLGQGGELFVQLWADGALAKEIAIPGAQVGATATLLRPVFSDLALEDVSRLTFQIGTSNPVGTSGPRNPADTAFTVFYDSVQHPAGLTLP